MSHLSSWWMISTPRDIVSQLSRFAHYYLKVLQQTDIIKQGPKVLCTLCHPNFELLAKWAWAINMGKAMANTTVTFTETTVNSIILFSIFELVNSATFELNFSLIGYDIWYKKFSKKKSQNRDCKSWLCHRIIFDRIVKFYKYILFSDPKSGWSIATAWRLELWEIFSKEKWERIPW